MRRVLEPGSGPMPTQPRIVLNTPVGLRVVEELPQQHRDDRRDDDRQVGEGAVEAPAAPDLAHQHRQDDRDREAEDAAPAARTRAVLRDGDAEQRVGQHALRSCRARPRSGSMTRFVSWKLMTTARTIGNQAKTPNTTSIGSRNTSVLRPSRVIRERRARRRGATRAAGPRARRGRGCRVGQRAHALRSPVAPVDPGGVVEDASPGRPCADESGPRRCRGPVIDAGGSALRRGSPGPAVLAASSSASMSAFSSVSTACTTGSRAA